MADNNYTSGSHQDDHRDSRQGNHGHPQRRNGSRSFRDKNEDNGERRYGARSQNRGYRKERGEWSSDKRRDDRPRRSRGDWDSNDRLRRSRRDWDSDDHRQGNNEGRRWEKDDERHDGRGGDRRFSSRRGNNKQSGRNRDGNFSRSPRKHAPRGGQGRDRQPTGTTSAQRAPKGPQIPDWVDPSLLPGDIRRELHMLSKDNADRVASHMIASYGLVHEDPEAALAHANAARDHAGRIAVVREHAGLISYLTGHWQEALGELRTARRIGGGPGLLSVMADCERGLGRPERAVEMLNSDYAAQLDAEGRSELLIVVAGARADMGQYDAAVVVLEQGDLNPDRTGDVAARFFYAYADALLAAHRKDDAITWFRHAATADEEGITDAIQRLDELETA